MRIYVKPNGKRRISRPPFRMLVCFPKPNDRRSERREKDAVFSSSVFELNHHFGRIGPCRYLEGVYYVVERQPMRDQVLQLVCETRQ